MRASTVKLASLATPHYSINTVDKRYATLGLLGTSELRVILDADHSEVCKFKSEEDSALKQVSRNILFLLEAAMVEETTDRILLILIEKKSIKGEYGVSYERHEEELSDTLSALFESLSDRQVHLYIDALHEEREEPAIDLANYFDSLVSKFAARGVALCVCLSYHDDLSVALNELEVVTEETDTADIREFRKKQLCNGNHRRNDRFTQSIQ
ncbi:hypothetical protein O1611_g6355 [Lasiodiplodia mahajangana]|uniref:Uncharacterized protein n=1 Tax=Lasiodiplodia mahajangana TaxID=1108764 RepID=A0ACC2JIH2_9PEZI|nr:hypothetical protein O1611_g6355 [Lasiodiplodia mahajangana]